MSVPNMRIGIVSPKIVVDNDEEWFLKRQFLLFIQYQVCMAGLPYELIEVDEYQSRSERGSPFTVLIVPEPNATIGQISDSLVEWVASELQRGGCGLLLIGDECESENINPTTQALYNLCDVELGEKVEMQHAEFRAGSYGEKILGDDFDWTGITVEDLWFRSLQQNRRPIMDVAQLHNGDLNESAIIAGDASFRYLCIADKNLLMQGNWLWRAIRWAAFGDAIPVGLRVSRSPCIMSTRLDMDLSMVRVDNEAISQSLIDRLTTWKRDYGFVCSAYINIGANPEAGKFTDWSISAPIHHELVRLGNEIGCHSFTHPFSLSELSGNELDFEFREAKQVIEDRLDISVRGLAVPGNPEPLETALRIGLHYEYMSGRFFGPGDGYPGAVGRLAADCPFVYFCPNLWPDFTSVCYYDWPMEKTKSEWQSQANALLINTSLSIFQPLWHDYGITNYFHNGFEIEIYESLLTWAKEQQAEFLTLGELTDRIYALEGAALSISSTQQEIEVSVSTDRASLGGMCLDVGANMPISGVDEWPAYNARQIFLPRNGGGFRIRLGGIADDMPRITALPNGAELVRLIAFKDGFECEIHGEGYVEVFTAGWRVSVDTDVGENPVLGESVAQDYIQIPLHGRQDKPHVFRVQVMDRISRITDITN